MGSSFKMVAISKNRKFFNCLLLHYYKSKLAKKNYCRYIAITISTYITDFSLEFFVKPMYTDYEIRHSLMKKKITFKSTHQNPLNQVKSNLTEMVNLGVHFRNCSRWQMLLKINISFIVHCCFIISQNKLRFKCSYMATSSSS